MKGVLRVLKNFKKKYTKVLLSIDDIDFRKIKNKVKKQKPLNNLVVLPIYEDESIYVGINDTISDIYDYPKE